MADISLNVIRQLKEIEVKVTISSYIPIGEDVVYIKVNSYEEICLLRVKLGIQFIYMPKSLGGSFPWSKLSTRKTYPLLLKISKKSSGYDLSYYPMKEKEIDYTGINTMYAYADLMSGEFDLQSILTSLRKEISFNDTINVNI